jgi:hypothetical protein
MVKSEERMSTAWKIFTDDGKQFGLSHYTSSGNRVWGRFNTTDTKLAPIDRVCNKTGYCEYAFDHYQSYTAAPGGWKFQIIKDTGLSG